MRRRVFAALLAVLSLLGFAGAQDALPKSHTCRITIDDPLPWLSAALKSQPVKEAFRSGALGDALTIAGVYQDLEPSTLWRRIRTFQSFVPKQVTIAFPPGTSGKVGSVLRGLVARELFYCTYLTERTKEAELEKIRAPLREELRTAIEGLPSMALSVALTCRSARVADEWFVGISETLEAWPENNETATLEVGDDHAKLVFGVGAAMTIEDFAGFFDEWVIEDEDLLESAWKQLKGYELHLDVRVDDDQLLFHLHPNVMAPAPVVAAPPAVPQVAGDGVFSCQFDLREFVSEVEGAHLLWDRYRKHEIGKLAASYDTSGFYDDLGMLAREAKRMALLSGAVNYSDSGIAYALHVPEADKVPPVFEDGIWRLIPAVAGGYSVDGRTTMAEAVYAGMVRFEEQLAKQSLRATVGGDEDAELLELDLEAYYARVTGLRKLLREDARQVLQPPFLTLLGTTRFDTRGDRFVQPQAGFAMAGKLLPGADGLAFAKSIVAEVAEIAEVDDRFEAKDVVADYALGVPTVSFPLRQVIGVTGDFVLHAFVVDGHLVVSTSLELSRSILRERGQQLVASGSVQTVHKGAANGARISAWLGTLGTRIGQSFADVERGMSSNVFGSLRLGICAAADVAGLFGACEFETVATPRGHYERGDLWFGNRSRDRELEDVLQKARQAHGPWPDRAVALRAAGDSRYREDDGKFTFTCGKDGHFHNRIKAVAYEENVWTGGAPWSLNEGRVPRTIGREEWRVLIAFNAIWSGQWTESPAGMQVRLADDALPGTPPEILISHPGAGQMMRLWLDPATYLPSAYGIEGQSLLYSRKNALSDYREVRGRMLPYRVQASDEGGGYRVKSWKVATLRAGRPARPSAVKDTSFKGAPRVEFRAGERGEGNSVRVQAGGKKVWLRFQLLANETSISRGALREMGCNVSDEDRWATVKKLRIGPMTIKDLVVAVAGDPPEPVDADQHVVHGVIGLALAGRSCIEFDYQNDALLLYKPGSFADDRGDFVSVGYLGRCPTVPLQLDRKTVVDCQLFFAPTANKVTFFNCSSLAGYRVPRADMRVFGATASHGLLATTMQGLKLAGQKLDSQTVAWPVSRRAESALPGPTVHLGLPLLQEDFVLLLDLPNDRAALVPR